MVDVGRDPRRHQIEEPLMDVSQLGRYSCHPGLSGPRFKHHLPALRLLRGLTHYAAAEHSRREQ
jgi:hypothetical protein